MRFALGFVAGLAAAWAALAIWQRVPGEHRDEKEHVQAFSELMEPFWRSQR